MEEKYKIIDDRFVKDFNEKTFSGYKKNDVVSALFKSIDANKVENACNWITECIISGYTFKIWDKILLYAFKTIHINNPQLPHFLLNKNTILYNQYKRLNTNNKDIVLILRNSQMIRNLFFDVITTLCSSSKTKKYDKTPKISNEDFDYQNLRSRLCATMNLLPEGIIHFNDPEELKIFINEFYFNLKNPLVGYDKCCYWVQWLIKWDELHKKKKSCWQIDMRDVPLKDKFKSDIIWVIWDCIYEEIKHRKQNNTKNIELIEKQIISLKNLFMNNYSSGKRNGRLPYLFLAIGYVTLEIKSIPPIRKDIKIFIQSQNNVNCMFLAKKVCEIKSEIFCKQDEENKKIKKKSNDDIMTSKINIFNDLNF